MFCWPVATEKSSASISTTTCSGVSVSIAPFGPQRVTFMSRSVSTVS